MRVLLSIALLLAIGCSSSEPPTLDECGGVNIDKLSNPLHCGACDNACAAGFACVEGVCLGHNDCGDGVKQWGEEWDPPLSLWTTVPVTPLCRSDFSGVAQLYCSGSCSWAGAGSCDQPDADIFCKLKTGNPLSVATSFTTATALALPGFSCSGAPSIGTDLGAMPWRGISQNVWYSGTSILASHGSGTVITSTTCTNP